MKIWDPESNKVNTGNKLAVRIQTQIISFQIPLLTVMRNALSDNAMTSIGLGLHCVNPSSSPCPCPRHTHKEKYSHS